LLFFLRNIRSTLIIAVSIPLSIIAAFVLIYFCGFTLNVMTLGGLALGIGMLVDNAIVVLENITRLRDEGLDNHQAAIQGTDEVTAAIIASTLTTIAVFLPLVFVKGMAGLMFRQFSAVVAFSLACSLFTAISLVPMMAARILRPSVHHDDKREQLKYSERLFVISSRWFTTLESFYSNLLCITLNWRWTVILGSLTLLGLTILLYPLIGTELMPKADEGVVRVYLEGAVGTRPEIIDATVQSADKIIVKEIPEMTGWVSRAGSSTWHANGAHKGNYNIKLVPKSDRKRSSEEIAFALGKKLEKIPGVTVRTRSGQGLFFMKMASATGENLTIDIRGHDFATADRLAQQIMAAAKQVKGVTDVILSRDLGVPEQRIVIDRQKAADLKVSVKTIADALRTVLAGSSAGEFRENGEEYTILVKVKNAENMTLDRILNLTVRNADGSRVVLRNLVKYDRLKGPVSIERKNQERIVTAAVNIFGRDLGSVVSDINEQLQKIPVPASFSINVVGDYEEQQKAFRDLVMAFALALVLVYMVMACQFESLRDPLVVMFSVPLAGIGVILALFLTDTTFNIQSFIGCIMLAGIVVNNAILLVDTANLLRHRDGMPLNDAIREAGRRRLRPILMTTLTTVLGLLPLAFGFGEGGETQAPLARAVIGGLTSSTLITLFLIPAVYSVAESILRRRPKA
ncbi:MAG: efflux RND transporter permease subunit, partial [Victivallaceae bacterium]